MRPLVTCILADPEWTSPPACAGGNILGCTLVEVLPDGEPWPVELGDLHRAYVPLTSKQPMWFPWQTVVAAAVLSGKTPNVLRAIKLVPVGRQHLHHVEVLPGLRSRRTRTQSPYSSSTRNEFPVLKTVVNSSDWGIQAEFHTTKSTEWPAPWCFPPIAATVAAGPRLLLALLDKMVRDAGGAVVYRDTDSSFVTGLCPRWLCIKTHFTALDQGWGVWKSGALQHARPGPQEVHPLRQRRQPHRLERVQPPRHLRGPPGPPRLDEELPRTHHPPELALDITAPVPTYLTQPAVRRLQTKPGCPTQSRPSWIVL